MKFQVALLLSYNSNKLLMKENIPCSREKALGTIDVQHAELPKVELAQIIFCQVLKNRTSKRTLFQRNKSPLLNDAMKNGSSI